MEKTLLFAIIIFVATSATAQKTNADTSQVFTEVDKVPEFPGGSGKFVDYVNKSLKETPRTHDVLGTVFVAFIVEKDGSCTKCKAVKSLNAESDSIAIAIVDNTPKWTPAFKNGQPVRCSYSVPIRFGNPASLEIEKLRVADPATTELSYPGYRGGYDSLRKFVKENIKIPPTCVNVTGFEVLVFYVESDGTVTDIHIIKSVCPELDQEAVRLITITPKWRPALKDGKPVRSLCRIPIYFPLSKWLL